MAIKKVVTDELFNEYILEQLKPYIDLKDSSTSQYVDTKVAAEKTQREEQIAQEAATRQSDVATLNSCVVHKNGNEYITGDKHFDVDHSTIYFTINDYQPSDPDYSIKIDYEGIHWSKFDSGDVSVKWDSDAGGLYIDNKLRTASNIITETCVETPAIYTTKIGNGRYEYGTAEYKTVDEIFDAVNAMGNFKTRKEYEPEEGQIQLPKESTTFTLESLTAKGLEDSNSITIVASDLKWRCESTTKYIMYDDLDITLYKTGSTSHMDDGSGRYGYDNINFETKKIERWTEKLSLWDIFMTPGKYVATDWSWSKTGGTVGYKGTMTISHAKMTNYWGTYSPDASKGELILNFGFNIYFEGVFDWDSGFENSMLVKANASTLSIGGWADRVDSVSATGKEGVIAFIQAHEQDAKNSYIIFKRQAINIEPLSTIATVNNVFKGSDSDYTYITGLGQGIVKVGFLSVEDKFYTKAQIDHQFETKAALKTKYLIYSLNGDKKPSEMVASNSLYSEILNNYISFAVFGSNDGTVPFIGPTLFIMQKEGSYNYLLAISNGSVYKWTGADTTQKNKLIQPYAARTYVFELEPSNWGSEKKQSFYFSELFEFEAAEADIMTTTPVSGYEQAYLDAGITRTFENDIITFSAETIPNDVIKVLLVYQKGEPLNITYTAISTTSEEDDAEDATEFDA